MKRLLLLFMLIPCFIHAQSLDKLMDDKIASAIKTQIVYDTFAVAKNVTAAGVFNIDTLACPVGSVIPYMVRFVIYGTGVPATACQIVWVSNTNGVYSSTVTSLKSGTGWILLPTAFGIQVRCSGSGTTKIKYEYKRIYL